MVVHGDRLYVIEAGYLKRRTAYSASGWLELGGLGKWSAAVRGILSERSS